MSECINEFYILNGEVKSVSEFDERYLKEGRALYEVIRIIDGVPLYLEKHLERLENTAGLTKDKLWLSISSIKESIKKLININKTQIGNIKMVFNFNKTNDFIIYFVEHHYPTEEMYKNGVKTILYHGERNNPNAKVIDLNFRGKVTEEMNRKNAFEAILVDNEGFITEGSKSNIFMIRGNKVVTSPMEDVLPGITRAMIIEVCNRRGIEVVEEKVYYKNIKDMDALFISGTSPKVLPINQVNEIAFKSTDNIILNSIKEGYDNYIKEYIDGKLKTSK